MRLLAAELMFDLCHGTDTFNHVRKGDINDIKSGNKTFGTDYEPANPKIFNNIFQDIEKKLGRNIAQDVLIDFGCGKGRPLLIAGMLGLKEAIGVEYSETLCAVARKNIEILKSRKKVTTRLQVVCSDAMLFDVPRKATIFLFVNPFGEKIMRHVLASISESVSKNPRNAIVIYMTPRVAQSFDPAFFRLVHTVSVAGSFDPQGPDASIYEVIIRK